MATNPFYLYFLQCVVLFLLWTPCTRGGTTHSYLIKPGVVYPPTSFWLDTNTEVGIYISVAVAIGDKIEITADAVDRTFTSTSDITSPSYRVISIPAHTTVDFTVENSMYTSGQRFQFNINDWPAGGYFRIVVSGPSPPVLTVPPIVHQGECDQIALGNLQSVSTVKFPSQNCQFFSDPGCSMTNYPTSGLTRNYYISCTTESTPTYIYMYEDGSTSGVTYVSQLILPVPVPSFSTVNKFQVQSCSDAITLSVLDSPSDSIILSASGSLCNFYSDAGCTTDLVSPFPTSSASITLYVSCSTASPTTILTATGNKGPGNSNQFLVYDPLSISSSTHDDVLCHGGNSGSATVVAAGGPEPYTYEWTPSTAGTGATVNNLYAGQYSVIVHSGSQASQPVPFKVVQPDELQITEDTALHTDVKCYGAQTGSAAVTTIGGKADNAYKYSWSPSANGADMVTGLGANTYTVTVYDDNSCHKDTTITIVNIQQSPLTATISNPTHVKCNGGSDGSATVGVTGGTIGSGYTYSWSPSGGTEATASGLTAQQYIVTVTDSIGCQTTATVTINEPAVISLSSAANQPPKCFNGSDGSATVLASGGTPASGNTYTYSWDVSASETATATGLSAGTAVVTVRDANQCKNTFTFTISQPDDITFTPTQTDVVCHGAATGVASVTVAGGTIGSGYSFSWSGGSSQTDTAASSSVSGLVANTYKVTVTDTHLCKASQSFVITEPDLFAITPNFTRIKCFGGTTKLNANPVGGTAPFKYSWSPAGGSDSLSTEVPKGIYRISASDNCQVSLATSVILPEPKPILLVPMQINVGCNGDDSGEATVYASGGTPGYTYLWAPYGGTAETATGLRAGTFNVTVTDRNGCQEFQTYIISEPAPVDFTYTTTAIKCHGASTGVASVSVSGGTNRYLYEWKPSVSDGPSASNLVAGSYTVTVADSNFCSASHTIVVSQPSAPLTLTASQNNVACYGGTGNATVTVSGGTPGYTYSWAPNSGNAATASDLLAGTYVVTVTDANGCSQTHQFVISQPAPLVVGASQKNVTCLGANNGVTVAKASGGTLPYSYTWTGVNSPNATVGGLSGGEYSVVVTDANGCFAVQNYTVNEPQSTFDVTIEEQDNVCKGAGNGSLQITPHGGFGNYTYKWSTGETTNTRSNLTAGSYRLTIMDMGGCVKQFSFNVTEPDVQFCKNDALCVANQTCICQGLWNGTDCSNPICPTGCLNGGTCTAPNTCTCATGFTGIACARTSSAVPIFVGRFTLFIALLAYLL